MTFRHIFFLLAAASLLRAGSTQNVILVTADGLRWQELFGGIDPLLMSEKSAHMDKAAALRKKFGSGATPEERRKALLPYFWSQFVPAGALYGNPARNSSVRVTNRYRVSYPGYSEILTGRAQDSAIRGNDPIQNPTETILEFVRRKLGLPKDKVALIGSWDTFRQIGEHTPGAVTINAGYQEWTGAASPRMRDLSRMQFEILSPWDEDRHDYLTLEMALDYLRTARPRLIHVALGETDDWAHDRRYDRVLQTINNFDESLRRLWTAVEMLEGYRGKTGMIVTTDHGRGSTIEDWSSHGEKVPGADRIWIALRGPDVRVTGEASGGPEKFQRDVAPTILDWLSIPLAEYPGVEGSPIRQ